MISSSSIRPNITSISNKQSNNSNNDTNYYLSCYRKIGRFLVGRGGGRGESGDYLLGCCSDCAKGVYWNWTGGSDGVGSRSSRG